MQKKQNKLQEASLGLQKIKKENRILIFATLPSHYDSGEPD